MLAMAEESSVLALLQQQNLTHLKALYEQQDQLQGLSRRLANEEASIAAREQAVRAREVALADQQAQLDNAALQMDQRALNVLASEQAVQAREQALQSMQERCRAHLSLVLAVSSRLRSRLQATSETQPTGNATSTGLPVASNHQAPPQPELQPLSGLPDNPLSDDQWRWLWCQLQTTPAINAVGTAGTSTTPTPTNRHIPAPAPALPQAIISNPTATQQQLPQPVSHHPADHAPVPYILPAMKQEPLDRPPQASGLQPTDTHTPPAAIPTANTQAQQPAAPPATTAAAAAAAAPDAPPRLQTPADVPAPPGPSNMHGPDYTDASRAPARKGSHVLPSCRSGPVPADNCIQTQYHNQHTWVDHAQMVAAIKQTAGQHLSRPDNQGKGKKAKKAQKNGQGQGDGQPQSMAATQGSQKEHQLTTAVGLLLPAAMGNVITTIKRPKDTQAGQQTRPLPLPPPTERQTGATGAAAAGATQAQVAPSSAVHSPSAAAQPNDTQVANGGVPQKRSKKERRAERAAADAAAAVAVAGGQPLGVNGVGQAAVGDAAQQGFDGVGGAVAEKKKKKKRKVMDGDEAGVNGAANQQSNQKSNQHSNQQDGAVHKKKRHQQQECVRNEQQQDWAGDEGDNSVAVADEAAAAVVENTAAVACAGKDVLVRRDPGVLSVPEHRRVVIKMEEQLGVGDGVVRQEAQVCTAPVPDRTSPTPAPVLVSSGVVGAGDHGGILMSGRTSPAPVPGRVSPALPATTRHVSSPPPSRHSLTPPPPSSVSPNLLLPPPPPLHQPHGRYPSQPRTQPHTTQQSQQSQPPQQLPQWQQPQRVGSPPLQWEHIDPGPWPHHGMAMHDMTVWHPGSVQGAAGQPWTSYQPVASMQQHPQHAVPYMTQGYGYGMPSSAPHETAPSAAPPQEPSSARCGTDDAPILRSASPQEWMHNQNTGRYSDQQTYHRQPLPLPPPPPPPPPGRNEQHTSSRTHLPPHPSTQQHGWAWTDTQPPKHPQQFSGHGNMVDRRPSQSPPPITKQRSQTPPHQPPQQSPPQQHHHAGGLRPQRDAGGLEARSGENREGRQGERRSYEPRPGENREGRQGERRSHEPRPGENREGRQGERRSYEPRPGENREGRQGERRSHEPKPGENRDGRQGERRSHDGKSGQGNGYGSGAADRAGERGEVRGGGGGGGEVRAEGRASSAEKRNIEGRKSSPFVGAQTTKDVGSEGRGSDSKSASHRRFTPSLPQSNHRPGGAAGFKGDAATLGVAATTAVSAQRRPSTSSNDSYGGSMGKEGAAASTATANRQASGGTEHPVFPGRLLCNARRLAMRSRSNEGVDGRDAAGLQQLLHQMKQEEQAGLMG